ncbi:hypothetical protein CRYUN_Cryun26dG0041700 [Craigia yunnanensis]
MDKPQKSLPGKFTTFLPGRTHLKATNGVSSVCEPFPPDRQLWFPGSTPPEWLVGSLPGDFGFDPLGLGSDPESLKWLSQAELMHARWAMLLWQEYSYQNCLKGWVSLRTSHGMMPMLENTLKTLRPCL